MKKLACLLMTVLCLTVSSSTLLAIKKPQINNSSMMQRDPYGYPVQTVSFKELRQLLLNRQYAALNKRLANYEQQFLKDFRNEYLLYDAYYTFAVPLQGYQPYFDEWVSQYPNSYQSHLARAFYFETMGWESRGYGWGKDTSREQFEAMGRYFQAALPDIDLVLQLNPNSICAYYLLIEILATVSADQKAETVVNQALELFPYSYLIRSIYLDFITPKWGGSYREMDQFATAAQAHVKINPRLQLLMGYSFAEQGWRMAVDQNDYVQANRLFDQALAFGEDWDAYLGKAGCYFDCNDPQSALLIVNKAIALNPQSIRSYAMRAKAYYKLGNYQQAVNDIQTAYQITPNYVTVRNIQLWITQSLVGDGCKQYDLKRYDAAISLFTWAIKMKPDYPNSYDCRGQTYCYKGQLELARKDYEQSIKLNPRNFDSYLSLDWVLAHTKQWDQIIANWNKYIALEPNDGRAYRERGGAYYHKGNLQAAVADAKKAAELGDAEGRKQYERFKNR